MGFVLHFWEVKFMPGGESDMVHGGPTKKRNAPSESFGSLAEGRPSTTKLSQCRQEEAWRLC